MSTYFYPNSSYSGAQHVHRNYSPHRTKEEIIKNIIKVMNISNRIINKINFELQEKGCEKRYCLLPRYTPDFFYYNNFKELLKIEAEEVGYFRRLQNELNELNPKIEQRKQEARTGYQIRHLKKQLNAERMKNRALSAGFYGNGSSSQPVGSWEQRRDFQPQRTRFNNSCNPWEHGSRTKPTARTGLHEVPPASYAAPSAPRQVTPPAAFPSNPGSLQQASTLESETVSDSFNVSEGAVQQQQNTSATDANTSSSQETLGKQNSEWEALIADLQPSGSQRL